MGYSIKSIIIRQLLGFKDLTIRIAADDELRHLIITGANGSGKTTLLKAILASWNAMADDRNMDFIDLGQVVLEGPDYAKLWNDVRQGNFILACYTDFRQPEFVEINNPEKPDLTHKNISSSKVNQFLRFMADLKIQQALAKNEGLAEDADKIEDWFTSFEGILKQIFNDQALQLKFNYKDYSFVICNDGKEFKFTQLSAGYAATLDIVVDLMLKMQQANKLRRVYDMPGIVLIDEVETHLHLQLQKQILPILTSLFPRIQFIVTSHSPFVLNSLKNVTVFDLEHQEAIEDLTEYSYESLTEGYFGVHTESSYIGHKLEKLKSLLNKDALLPDEKATAQQIANDFNAIPELISPRYVGEYRQLIINKGELLK